MLSPRRRTNMAPVVKRRLAFFAHDGDTQGLGKRKSSTGLPIMKHRILAVCLLLACEITGAHAQSFLCVGQLATGFDWLNGRWTVGQSDPTDEIFVLQPSGALDDYTVTRIGDQSPRHYCPLQRRSDSTLLLICGGLANGFTFSSKTLRFQENYGIGYTNAGDSRANTPHLVIGKCTRLELRGVIE